MLGPYWISASRGAHRIVPVTQEGPSALRAPKGQLDSANGLRRALAADTLVGETRHEFGVVVRDLSR